MLYIFKNLVCYASSDIIHIVNFQTFTTTKMTLCKDPHSFLYRLCQDDYTSLTTDKVWHKQPVVVVDAVCYIEVCVQSYK